MQSLGLIHQNYKPHYSSSRNLVHTSQRSINSLNICIDTKKTLKETSKRVSINASGLLYETYEKTLDKYPETILGTAEKRLSLIDPVSKIIFFNRHRASFEAILYFFQSSGNLVRPENVRMSDFEEECRFYQLPENAIKRMKNRECFLYRKKEDSSDSYLQSTRYKCWTFIETPLEFGSAWAFVYFLFSYSMIIFSIILYCMHSELILHLNAKDISRFRYFQRYFEISFNIFFAVELGVRFLVSPHPKIFLLKPVNFLEMISVTLFLFVSGFEESRPITIVLDVSRILYTFRIIRLSRVSKVVKMSFTVFQEAIDDVMAVLFTLLIIVIFGGTVMYYFETNVKGTQFTSIPQSMWWAVQTSICLGYGDIVPETILGRYIGSFVLYGGVVIVMVLILSLGGRVFDMYIKEFDETCGGFLPNIDDTKNKDLEIHYKDPL